MRVLRGVRSAKEWFISTCRTVPGTRIVITSPCGDSLLGRSGEQCSNPTSCPGIRDHAPGIYVWAKPRKKPKTTHPSIAPRPTPPVNVKRPESGHANPKC